MRRHLILLLLLYLSGLARGQTDGYSSYYWFDFQQGKPQTSPVVQGTFDVDATALAEGLHAFHYVVAMQDGGISSPITTYFMKESQDDATVKGYYWFNDETKVREAMVTNGTFEVDASSLSDGFHRFYYQALQANGVTSTPSISYFLKAAQVESDGELTCICTVDGQLCHTETLPHESGVIHWNLDMQDLAEGLHQLRLDVLKADGAMSDSQHSFFVKVPEADASIKGYYWFDEETDTREAMVTNGTFEVNASSLSDGFHRFYYQALQANGVTSTPSISYFLKTSQENPEEELTCICTVDGQLRHIEKLSQQGGAIHWNLDMQDLAEGLHQLQIDALKADGAMSDSQHCFFVKVPESDTSIKGYYWFDEETAVREAIVTNGTFEVDASSLSDGFHKFYYLALQANGVSSLPSTNYFLKTAQVDSDGELTCICTVDGQLCHMEKLSLQGGAIHWNLDMQDLTEGIHQIQLHALTSGGALSSSYASYFMRVTNEVGTSEMSCIYTIDGNPLSSKSHVVSHDGSYHFDLNLSELEEGLHYISYMLHGDKGTSATPQIRFFVKVPLGGNGIDQYQYWLNDDEANQATTVTLPQKVNPLQLMSLLPVESRPLRSSQFHFDVSGNKPMIYAKNTIHLRFYDVAKWFSDVDKEYADYSKSREVEPVGELQATQTFPKIEENDIRWYTMQSAPGDTVAFKLSQPATIQLFTPSGAEVFKTSESASVNWGGIHVWEDGTYYLAVHDVTGSKEEITLEYMHMDKYDVVDWDVHRVGNGGCSTITFKGNGFHDLYAVDLVVAPGDTIHSVYISHDSDAETAVAFDFTGATLGDYNAVFHFTEEDKPVANVVTVEEAIDIELATDVSFPSSFLRGTSTTYTIKITNKGNMTAYAVPIYTFIKSHSKDGITNIKYEGLGLENLFDYSNLDSLSDEEIRDIRTNIESMGDMLHFMSFHVKDDATGDSVWVRSNNFFLDIAPLETTTLKLVINATEEVQAYFTLPKTLNSLSSIEEQMPRSVKGKNPIINHLCCYHDRYECVLNEITDVADLIALISAALALADIGTTLPVTAIASVASCATSVLSQGVYEWSLILCNNEMTWWEKIKERFKLKSTISIASTIWNCAGGEFLKTIKKLKKVREFITALSEVTADGAMWKYIVSSDCKKAWTEKKTNCPPDPGGGGGTSTPRPPADPNDIFGYLSEAGSKFIADSVARVNYTIEFENDTTFATAAAHTIVIKDTLDSRYFELTKFMPTGVRIGSREAFLNESDIVVNNDKTTFVKTIDMRPEINAIAQVNGEYNQKNGIAHWTFQSLDPMTMEPTDDLMQGILPVNYDGTSGIGEVMFEIGVKFGKADGAELKNRAGIVFDYEEAILTPTWTNIVDAIAPSSLVDGLTMLNDSTLRVFADANDARSGVWKYEWYVQHGENAPWWKEGETYDDSFDFHFYEGFDYGFCVIVTDSAGNVEKKELARERVFKSYGKDFEDTIDELPASRNNNDGDSRIYDISGRKHDEPQENQINIIRHSAGTSRKVLVK